MFFLPNAIYSQKNEIIGTKFINLTQNDGLSSETAYSILQDRQGYIWVGTLEGLNRYDGYSFKSFQHSEGDAASISNNIINALAEGPEGKVWVATIDGVNVFNPETESFTIYRNNPNDDKSISGNWVSGIHRDHEDQMWFLVNNKGINLFNAEKGTFSNWGFNYPEGNDIITFSSITSNAVDRNNLWLSTISELYQFDKTSNKFYQIPLNIENPSEIWIQSLFLDDKGYLWVGTEARGIYRYDIKTRELKNYKDNNYNSNIQYISRKTHNELWLASGDKGLGVFNTNNNTFSFYKNDPEDHNSILSNKAFQVITDNAGITWIAMHKGVSRIDHRTQLFKHVPVDKSIENSFFIEKAISLPENRGFLVFLSGHSDLYHIDNKGMLKSKTVLYDSNGAQLKNTQITDVLQTKNKQVWVLEKNGLFLLDNTSNKFYHLPNFDVNSKLEPSKLFEDAHDNLWVIGLSGKYISVSLKTQEIKKYDYSLTGGNIAIRDLHSIKENLWLATEFGTKIILDVENQSLNYMYIPDSLNLSIPATSVTETPSGKVWIGTLKGAYTYDTVEENPKAIKTSIDLLAHEKIYKIIAHNKKLWFATANGLVSLDPITGSYRVYNDKDGLKFNDMNYSMNIDYQGNIIIGYPFGFCYFHPDSLGKNNFLPPVVFNSFKVFDKEIIYNNNINYIENIQLSYKQNFLSFTFSALGYTNSEQNQYAYILDGVDENWNFIGNRRYASYTNLSGGNYIFKVKAANNDGIWNSNIASINIFIKPPFWNTTWFYTLASFMGIAFIIGFYKFRVGQIRQKEKVKTEYNKQIAEAKMTAFRAQMNPHFLFNCLNSINRYILKKDPMVASEYLTKFSKLMRQILDNSKDATITLENELTALNLYIQLEALRFENKFEFMIEVGNDVATDYIQIPPLLLQPYVENAIWHGLMHKKEGQAFLLVKIDLKGDYLKCIVEDNGIGRVKALELKSKSATQNKSMGMDITSERITLMRITDPATRKNPVMIIDLKDENGKPKGTRVELLIPT